ncbi:MAG: ROK family protein [Dehalococcoidia bacterium]
MRTILAADLGGTSLRAALVDEQGHLSARAELDTPERATGDQMVETLVQLLSSVLATGGPAPAAACIASAGLIDGDHGRVIVSENIPGFRNLVLTEPVSERLGTPCFIENDASAAALGEFRWGAGRGLRHLLHATLGTGIGGGIVINGRLYRGSRGLAGEIGHTVIDPAGPACNCGSRGCVEALVSGFAFAARARRLMASGKPTILNQLVQGRPPDAVDLYAAAAAGDTLAEAEIRNGGHILGLALGGMVNVLNPDAVTLSGGLLKMGDMFLQPLRDAMYSLPYGPASGTLVRLSELGDDTGLLGAAAVAIERLDTPE